LRHGVLKDNLALQSTICEMEEAADLTAKMNKVQAEQGIDA
jgi:hypothetical protein